MSSIDSSFPRKSTLQRTNEAFYDSLWRGSKLVRPERFNTWPLVSSLLPLCPRRLEIGPGLRPRLPIQGTEFVDISKEGIDSLIAHGGAGTVAEVGDLPFENDSFDLICALDIIEHVDDDEKALAEISRVAAQEAILILSTPLHPSLWTSFDDFVGHHRRYTPEAILSLLVKHDFVIEQSTMFGMKPGSSLIVNIGMWFLENQRERAMWWYNLFFPLTVRFQKQLQLRDHIIDLSEVGEALFVCRMKRRGSSAS